MPRRKPRIISRAVLEAASGKKIEVEEKSLSSIPYVTRVRTRLDEIRDLIITTCDEGWRFTDEDGRPWIDSEGIEDLGNGIYVVRFRCPLETLYTRASLNSVVKIVCDKLKSEIRYMCGDREVRYRGGIVQRYYECVWVIKDGDLKDEAEDECDDGSVDFDSIEEIEGELKCESTADELDENIDEAMNNFV